jgi:hypothetical protein
MESDHLEDAIRFIDNYWFHLASTIFDRVVEVCELDKDQTDALRSVALKPMNFSIKIKK